MLTGIRRRRRCRPSLWRGEGACSHGCLSICKIPGSLHCQESNCQLLYSSLWIFKELSASWIRELGFRGLGKATDALELQER